MGDDSEVVQLKDQFPACPLPEGKAWVYTQNGWECVDKNSDIAKRALNYMD